MLDIKGTNVKLWANERDGRNGKFVTFSISFSKKDGEKYINKPVKVFFGRDTWIPETAKKGGATIDFEGFPTLDVYTDRDGNERKDIAIYIKKVDWKDISDSFEEAEADVPF